MSHKKQQRWKDLRAIYIATTGSTANRSTELNDYRDEEKLRKGYLGGLYRPLQSDL